ncbi:MAG TPA: YciI family protein, partial [Blastocatellia bacterium]|nr:YciI family protein [Blastocatellia bacterium]
LMKKFSTKLFLAPAAVWLLAAIVVAQDKPAQAEPQYDMGKMQMVFLKRAQGWKATAKQTKQVKRDHEARVAALIKDGKCALAGSITSDGDLDHVLVFKNESVTEIQSLAESLPGVRSGMLKAEVVSWYAARNMITPPKTPIVKTNYVFGVLVRGPNWSPTMTDETKKIQEGHMANINRLAAMGKLVLAGPFIEGGDRRGIFIFKVNSLEEAERLTNTDPAVIAGRLKIELHRWAVPAGMLP